MKISIYSPLGLPDLAALAELLSHVPSDTKEVIVQAPPRRAIDLRSCQRPGHLEYAASCDNKVFVHLSQVTASGPYSVKVTQ